MKYFLNSGGSKSLSAPSVVDTAVHDILNALSKGVVFFDAAGTKILSNRTANAIAPPYRIPNQGQTLSDYLDFIYNAAVDVDESLRITLGKLESASVSNRFREVVSWGDGKYCLAEMQKTQENGTILFLHDISERRAEEDKILGLYEDTYRLGQAIEASTNGVIMTDPSLTGHPIKFVNAALCNQLKVRKEDMIGKPVSLLVERITDKDCKRRVLQALANAMSLDLEIKIGGRRDDRDRWFNFQLTPLRGRSGDLGLFVGILTETTELKIKEAEFFKAQKLEALGQLSAGIAHDFNNILSIIDGYALLAESKIPPDSPAAEAFHKIRNASQRAGGIIKQMLTFSHHTIVENDVINLREALKAQEVLLRPLLDATITLSIEYGDEDIYVETSEESITQILMNLIVNARDAMPDGGRITVEASRIRADELTVLQKEKYGQFPPVRLRVCDTGSGIPDDIRQRIFDPFFTTKGQGKGTGLGLSVVYGLVRQMKGELLLETQVGKGSCFEIILPQAQRPAVLKASLVDFRASGLLEGYTALVAEDEPDLLELTAGMLEKIGLNVLRACDGNQALALQDKYKGDIDVLLTDVVMPDLDGLRLAKLFESLRPKTQVIFMSGYPAKGQHARFTIPDNALYMAKPFTGEDLRNTLIHVLGDDKSLAQAAGLPVRRWDASVQHSGAGFQEMQEIQNEQK